MQTVMCVVRVIDSSRMYVQSVVVVTVDESLFQCGSVVVGLVSSHNLSPYFQPTKHGGCVAKGYVLLTRT